MREGEDAAYMTLKILNSIRLMRLLSASGRLGVRTVPRGLWFGPIGLCRQP